MTLADRRMFSKTIIDSDAFMDMPLSTQALYFHLAMRADDDGFVGNPKKIQRMTNCTDDDAKLLIAKQFIIPFDSGVVVIRHWRIHNYIQKDRYKPTIYAGEKEKLTREHDTYDLKEAPCPTCIQSVSKVDTQVRLGQVRLGQDSLSIVEQSSPTQSEILLERFEKWWKAYPVKTGKGDARKRWLKIKPSEEMTDTMIRAVERMRREDQRWLEGFIPNPATWLNQERWTDEPVTTKKQNNNPSKIMNERDVTDDDYADWYHVELKNK